MGRANAHRDKKIIAFLLFRNQRPITYGVGPEAMRLHISFVLYISIGIHISLYMMGVHTIGGHTNSIPGHFQSLTILLGHNIIADHSPSFTNIKLLLPAVPSFKFILGGPPL